MANRETALMKAIRVAVCILPGCRAWRNSRGFDERAKAEYGLAKGASDLIGIVDGRFLALEVKVPGETPTDDQQRFIDAINRLGGVGAVVRSVDDALEVIRRARANAQAP
jgi:hypothetical protein